MKVETDEWLGSISWKGCCTLMKRGQLISPRRGMFSHDWGRSAGLPE